MTKKQIQRFWSKVSRLDPRACWEWTAGKHQLGYGRLAVSDGRAKVVQYAHRIAWELTHGAPPAGLHVLHRCDNPPCCNPAHLFLGTHRDNMRDRNEKGRLRPPRGSRNGMAKLSEADAADIRRRYVPGVVTHAELASRYDVSKTTIGSVLRGHAWVPE